MFLKVKTTKRITAKCHECGFEIYIEGNSNLTVNGAERIFTEYEWHDDDGKALCPDCYGEKISSDT